MNGVHDLGGTDGFGPVPYVVEEPTFHEAWEGRVYALAGAGGMAGFYGTPQFRHAIERIAPARYLSCSYYERWTTAISSLLVEAGVLTPDELEAEAGGAVPLCGPVRAPAVDPGADVTAPRFAPGDEVRARNVHPLGHTRCPRYVRGRRGSVVRSYGPMNFDDVEAHCEGKRLDPVYCVRFDAGELWGEAAEPGVVVHVDLFESYLEAP